MIINYDIYNQLEVPNFILCNPSKEELFSLNTAYDKNIKLRYNGISEISFKIPKKVLSDKELPVYDYIKNKRLVLVENIGYFIISTSPEDNNGSTPIMEVQGESLESELKHKKLTAFGGTYKFYDSFNPSGTLMKKITELAPAWSIGHVDTELMNIYRTFSVSDSNVYNFLMTDVSKAYGCIFVFDTFLRTISAYTYANAVTATDIFLSYENLIKKSTFKEMSDEIATCLYVYGGNNLDIRSVNPLGTNAIYNFGYFKNTQWMSQALIDKLNYWEGLIASAQPGYSDLLVLLKNKNAELVVAQGQLAQLNSEYLSLQGVQKVRIESSLPFDDITIQMNAKQLEINGKQADIDSLNLQITDITNQLKAINNSLSFSTVFTVDEFSELSNYIYENTYQNENIIITDNMSNDEIQTQAEQLYNQAVYVMNRIAYPKYDFSMDLINFLYIKEFNHFTSQLNLGSSVVIDVDKGYTIESVLLEISINYDKPEDFSLTFSNRLRLDNAGFVFSDLFGQVVKTGSSVSFNNLKWSDWESNYKNEVTGFITSSLDASKNAIINATNQEILINQNGLRGRTYDSGTASYNPTQVWLTSSILAFTDDNWESAKLALGEVDVNGVKKFGLVADFVVGKLLAGNQLTIANENNSFVLDSNGATLTNATFNLVNKDNTSKISLNPDVGIKIESKILGTWTDKLYIDSSGNLVFKGDLTGASGTFSGNLSATTGTIGGWNITSTGISDSYGNYIRSNGQIKLGNLLITGSTATFTGTIYADKLVGQITQPQIANSAVGTDQIGYGNLDAGVVGYGNMSGDFVYGGSIGGVGGSSMNLSQSGQITMTSEYIQLLAGVASIQIDGNSVGLYGGVVIGGGIEVNGKTGLTTTFTVSGHTFRFQNGILY